MFESTVEEASRSWFGELGYEVLSELERRYEAIATILDTLLPILMLGEISVSQLETNL